MKLQPILLTSWQKIIQPRSAKKIRVHLEQDNNKYYNTVHINFIMSHVCIKRKRRRLHGIKIWINAGFTSLDNDNPLRVYAA